MGKQLEMAPTGEFILWAKIPEGASSFANRAYGPFHSRSAAYSVRKALTNRKRNELLEQGFSEEDTQSVLDEIEWSTTGLWRKIDGDRLIDPVEAVPDTIEERMAEAIWNNSAPVKKGARPKWRDVRNDPKWKRGVNDTRADALAAKATLEGTAEED
ncbi:hypothetical protein ANMWB30_23060 [Arthrobacter sp. MWB30]|nr:hypothetical protein ANMWB30_23060 [Arthrobacter sp. MWB30]